MVNLLIVFSFLTGYISWWLLFSCTIHMVRIPRRPTKPFSVVLVTDVSSKCWGQDQP